MAIAPKQMTRPMLATRRLILEPLRPRHARDVYGAIEESRASLGRWLPFVHTTRSASETEAFIRRVARSECDIVWGVWLRDEENGPRGGWFGPRRPQRYCGNVGMHRVFVEQATGEVGYWVRRSREGQGIITEAVAAVLLWAFGPLNLERLAIEAATGNAASLRVVEKLGFVREGVLREAQRIPGRRARLDLVISGLVRSDFAQARHTFARYCGTARPWEGRNEASSA